MFHKSEDCPVSGLKREYSTLFFAEICLEPEDSILLSSVVAESADVSVEEFKDVQDADGNNFFKVEFE